MPVKRVKKRIRPDMTPLIDVVFLLLVFFLVSSMFKKQETTLNLSLPKVDSKNTLASETSIQIELKQDSLAVNGNTVDWGGFDLFLKGMGTSQTPILVRVDQKTTYEWVAKLLDHLQKHQCLNVQLVQQLQRTQ